MEHVEYLTKERKAELEAELHVLETTKRQEVLDALTYAKSLGDLSENAEYHSAREAQGYLEDRINHLTEVLRNAKIVERHHATSVELGATVQVENMKTKDKKKFMIVGVEEANTTAGKISFKSPLGAALMGHAMNDVAKFSTPGGVVEYKILSIE
jgi:transcription elongation factor GreA